MNVYKHQLLLFLNILLNFSSSFLLSLCLICSIFYHLFLNSFSSPRSRNFHPYRRSIPFLLITSALSLFLIYILHQTFVFFDYHDQVKNYFSHFFIFYRLINVIIVYFLFIHFIIYFLQFIYYLSLILGQNLINLILFFYLFFFLNAFFLIFLFWLLELILLLINIFLNLFIFPLTLISFI